MDSHEEYIKSMEYRLDSLEKASANKIKELISAVASAEERARVAEESQDRLHLHARVQVDRATTEGGELKP